MAKVLQALIPLPVPPSTDSMKDERMIRFGSSIKYRQANPYKYVIIKNDPRKQPLIRLMYLSMVGVRTENMILNVANVAMLSPRYILSSFFSIKNLGKNGSI